MNVSWMTNPQYLAQVGHFFGAYAIAFTVGVLTTPYAFWSTVTVGLGAAAVKEFIFDTASWGEGDSWKDSAMDFAFYVAGTAVAAVVWIAWRHA